MSPTVACWWRALGALAMVLLSSCGIRLPVEQAAETRRVEVRLEAPPSPRDPDVMIWLVADSYHTGLVFPYDWLTESGFVPPAGFPVVRYVMMSWGNRDAYSPQGLDNPWKIFRVLFTPTPSVMELIPMNWHVAEVLPDQRLWRKLVPRERGPALAAFLNGCSVLGPDGKPRVVCPSSWGGGVQLESRHDYFVPRVCNIWTVQALESLGADFNPWRSTTASGLIRQAERPPNDFELIWPGTGNESPQ